MTCNLPVPAGFVDKSLNSFLITLTVTYEVSKFDEIVLPFNRCTKCMKCNLTGTAGFVDKSLNFFSL